MSETRGALYANGTTSAQIKATGGKVFGISVNSHSSGTVRFNDGTGGTTGTGVKATGVFTGTDVLTNGETITIDYQDMKTYTMVTALSSPAVPNEVVLGTLAVSLDNLNVAINGGAGAGTLYSTGTIAHQNVVATTNTDTAQTIEALRVGTYANSISTTETCADASWGAVVMENGAEINKLVTNTYTFAAGSQQLEFAEPIVFDAGIYITVGGTINYTVLYN